MPASNPFIFEEGWYYYLRDKLQLPFQATCRIKRATSPLQVGTQTEVVEMAAEDDCMSEIFVIAQYGKSGVARGYVY